MRRRNARGMTLVEAASVSAITGICVGCVMSFGAARPGAIGATAIVFQTGFQQAADLAIRESGVVVLVFTPTAANQHNATLALYDNLGIPAQPVWTGTLPASIISITGQNVSAGTTQPLIIYVDNYGRASYGSTSKIDAAAIPPCNESGAPLSLSIGDGITSETLSVAPCTTTLTPIQSRTAGG